MSWKLIISKMRPFNNNFQGIISSNRTKGYAGYYHIFYHKFTPYHMDRCIGPPSSNQSIKDFWMKSFTVRELIYFQVRNFVQRTLRDFRDTRNDFWYIYIVIVKRHWAQALSRIEPRYFLKILSKTTVRHFSFGWFRKG